MISVRKFLEQKGIDLEKGLASLEKRRLISGKTTVTPLGTKNGLVVSKMYNATFLAAENSSLEKLFSKTISYMNANGKKGTEVTKEQKKPVNTAKSTKKPTTKSSSSSQSEYESIRTKFPANYRTSDWHFVRSKAEQIIDDYLYNNGIIHAYERKLPVEEDLYSDFYIPIGDKVYIEYWGYENDSKYLYRKEKKIQIYKKYNLNLIELTDKDIENLDDILPQKLLPYRINFC